MEDLLKQIKFNEKGLIPAVVQDFKSKEVLMVAYMNEESILKTISEGKACFWSRSRQELWLKGETSGNYQFAKEIRLDCDNDTILLLVEAVGPACHTGQQSCFYRKITNGYKLIEDLQGDLSVKGINKAVLLQQLYQLIADRKAQPREGSYTSYLFREGIDKICKKVGEESAEVIIAAKNQSAEEIIYETADLIYHLLVLLNYYDIPLNDILDELASRRK